MFSGNTDNINNRFTALFLYQIGLPISLIIGALVRIVQHFIPETSIMISTVQALNLFSVNRMRSMYLQVGSFYLHSRTYSRQACHPVSISDWAGGEPNNHGGNENCATFHTGDQFNDLNCLATQLVLCESDETSIPAGSF